MEKSIFVADTHLGIHKAADVWHKVTVDLFREIADVGVRRNIKRLYHFGDFFDNRRHINIKTLNAALQIADLIKDFETYIIIGNHDTFYRDNIYPTSLSVFDEYPNIHVVDKITEHEDAVLVPWGTKVEDIPTKKYALGHFEIYGFPVVSGVDFQREDVKINDFTRFEQVFTGHFHIPSTRNNITYLGSAFQSNFGDVGSERGYYIFDDGKLEFCRYKDAPQFVIVFSDEPVKPSVIKGNIVKLVYRKDYGSHENTKILENIQLYQPLQLFTDFGRMTQQVVHTDDGEEIIQLKSNKDILFEYINKITIPSHIKTPVLKNVIEGILREE